MARQPNEDGYRASAVDNFIDRLEVSYAQIVDENQRLKSSPGGMADENLRRQLDSMAQERDELGRQRADLQGRLVDMQNRLAAASQGDPGQQAAMRAHIDELTRANQELQARMASIPQSDPGQMAAMQGRIEELMRANQDLRSQLSVMPNGAAEQLSRASEENASLRSHAAVLESQVRDLQGRLASQPAGSGVGVIEGDTRRIVVTTSAEASPAVVLLVQQTLQQVQVLMDNAKRDIDQHRAEAEIEARRLVETATQQASELSRRAQTDAESLKADATMTADRVIAEARSRASAIDTEVAERRSQIFGQLEHEKDQLSQRIGQLRDFESQYRSSMTSHLQRQLDSLREIEFAPSNHPELVDSNRTSFSLGR